MQHYYNPDAKQTITLEPGQIAIVVNPTEFGEMKAGETYNDPYSGTAKTPSMRRMATVGRPIVMAGVKLPEPHFPASQRYGKLTISSVVVKANNFSETPATRKRDPNREIASLEQRLAKLKKAGGAAATPDNPDAVKLAQATPPAAQPGKK